MSDNQTREGVREDHHLISPTAKLVAYWRGKTDIPHARYISQEVDAEKTARELLGEDIAKIDKFGTSYIEARYKGLDHGLRKTGNKNTLEIAVGILPRGLVHTEDPETIYVGTDLPEMLDESAKVMAQVQTKEGISRPNLYFMPANALNLTELEFAAKPFGNQPFNICHEGLLPYLERNEQAILARNIHTILTKNGGYWVTTDVVDNESRKKRMAIIGVEFKDVAQKAIAAISKSVKRNMMQGSFENYLEFYSFLSSLGFEVERIPMYNGNHDINSLNNIPEGKFKEDMIGMLKNQTVMIMTPKKI